MHLNNRPTLSLSHPFYHFNYPTFIYSLQQTFLIRPNIRLSNPFFHVHYPILTSVLPEVYVLPYLLFHLYRRPSIIKLSNPLYHFNYPTFTSCLPQTLLTRSTIFIIPPLHPFYHEPF